MVDCGSSRCAQDRRVLKKELLSWTKKVPILLGLEQIAETYVGEDAFGKIMEPFSGLEPEDKQDWTPGENCCFCQNTSETGPEPCTEQEETNRSDTEPGLDYYQHYLPQNYPSTLPPDSTTLDNSKPLDLSASARHIDHGCNQVMEESTQPLVELKVPQITNKIGKKKDLTGKRSYTEEDLSAAVSDIRSGKLGTRRAAALYGIPRSTLRNKIFRMETENVYEQQCTGNLSMADLLQNMANGEAGKTEWTSDVEWEHRLDLLRRKHDLNAGLDRPFGMPPLFFSNRHLMECEKAFNLSSPYDYEVKLPFLHELVRKFAEHRMEAERAHCLGVPFLSELMQGVPGCSGTGGIVSSSMSTGPVELKIPSYKPIRSYTNGSVGDPNNIPSDLSPPLASPSPSASSNKINDTLKDIIAKTIADKVRSRNQNVESDFLAGTLEGPTCMNGFHTQKHPREAQDLTIPQSKKFKRETKAIEKLQHSPAHPYDFNSPDQKSSDEGEQKPLKKTRPKRGQYRKYNSQLLLEAVRAVQRGEMSVHRAGSYFGVPHSTLEYKVKERHLMRQKKPREARGKKSVSSTGTSNKSASGLNIPTPGSSSSNSNSVESTKKMPAASHSQEDSDDPESEDCCPVKSAAESTDHSMKSSHRDSPGSSVIDTHRADTDPLSHSVNSLLSAGSASMNGVGGLPLPAAMSNFYMGANLPLGFGWPPLLNGGLPMGMPDPAITAAYLPGYGLNLSASDLLKKLQRKVQAKTSTDVSSPSSGGSRDSAQPIQGNKSNGSQVIVK